MEVEHIHTCKRSRIGNGSSNPKLGQKEQHQDDDEEDGERKGGGGRLLPWHHSSSRIFRVSRASGGKDRHSKVFTSKGLRDRRVRLSVSTAIQFYDLQDRLGYDQPSKAVEWLIKAASAAIAELPSLDSAFPDPPQPYEEKPNHLMLDVEMEAEPSSNQQQHSSTSETSKGSVLSLSRTEIRVKARERARERTAKEKEKVRDDEHEHVVAHNVNQNLNSQSSFTDLLTNGGNLIQKQIRQLPVTATTDYFGQADIFGQAQKTHQLPSGFSSQAHFGNSSPIGMVPFNPEMQQFSFMQDHLIPVAAVASGGDYSLNFSISSGLAGFNRGTLQSNSPSQLPQHQHHHHHLQRFSSPVEGSNLPFIFGAPAAVAENLQLYYSDGYRHSDMKGKEKN